MEKRGQIILGSALLVLGFLTLIGVVFHIDWGVLCWPALLILLGVWLLFRPQLETAGTRIILIGDVRRNGIWQVANETYWIGIGDVKIDFTQAEVPVGETLIQVNALIGGVKVIAPPGFALAITATGLILNTTVFGNHEDHFLLPLETATPGYETAERRVRLESVHFINDLKVRQE